MHVLITGGAGFLDRICVTFWYKKVLMSFAWITCSRVIFSNIAHIRTEKFLFINHDVTNYIYLDGEVDYIFAFCQSGQPDRLSGITDSNSESRFMARIKRWGWRRRKSGIFISVNLRGVWRSPHPPTREDYWGNVNPIGPRGVYDEAKRFAGP